MPSGGIKTVVLVNLLIPGLVLVGATLWQWRLDKSRTALTGVRIVSFPDIDHLPHGEVLARPLPPVRALLLLDSEPRDLGITNP